MTIPLIIKITLMVGSFGFLMLSAGLIVGDYSRGIFYKFSQKLIEIGIFSIKLCAVSAVAEFFYYVWMLL